MPQTRPVSVGNANTIRAPLPTPRRGGVSPSPGGGAEPDYKSPGGGIRSPAPGAECPVRPLIAVSLFMLPY